MSRILFVFVFILILFQNAAFSQDYLYSTQRAEPQKGQKVEGTVSILQDSRVDTILKRHLEYNQQLEGIDGYRIHIFFDAGNQSLSRANQAAAKYQMLYPTDTAYVSFSEPYYRVRVGDFRTRLDAEGYLTKIIADYPNAFVIKDKINFPKLD
jgi:hypothetical protein